MATHLNSRAESAAKNDYYARALQPGSNDPGCEAKGAQI